MASVGPKISFHAVFDGAKGTEFNVIKMNYTLKKDVNGTDLCYYGNSFLLLDISIKHWDQGIKDNKIGYEGNPANIISSFAAGYFAVTSAAWPLYLPRIIRFCNYHMDAQRIVIYAGFDTYNSNTSILDF